MKEPEWCSAASGDIGEVNVNNVVGEIIDRDLMTASLVGRFRKPQGSGAGAMAQAIRPLPCAR